MAVAVKREASLIRILKMRKPVIVTVTLLLTTAFLPFLWHSKMSQAEESEEDHELGRIVRSLNSVTSEQEMVRQQQQNMTSSFIHRHFPWLHQNNTMSNHFLTANQAESDRAVMVFLHHHRSAGSAVRTCLDEIARNYSYATSPIMDSDRRFLWDSIDASTEAHLRNRMKIHRGQYSFGLCDGLQQNCSYFTLLRHPMDRAVSSYHYCKNALGDEMCKVMNANTMTLRQWVLHHGSLLFQQLTFHPHWCDRDPDVRNADELFVDANKLPCWYKHKLWLDALAPSDHNHLLEYVLSNMDKWFGALGIYEHLDNTLHMFEHIYKLPFSKCQYLRKIESKSNTVDNRTNRKKRWEDSDSDEEYLDNDPEDLKYDYSVERALDADMKIYKKAFQIFQLQRQVFSNKL